MKKSQLLAAIYLLLAAGYMSVNLFQLDSVIVNSIRVGAILLILFLVFYSGLNFQKLHVIALLLGAFTLAGSLTSAISMNVLFLVVFVIATRTIEMNDLLRLATFSLGLMLALTFVFLLLGVTQNSTDVVGLAPGLGDELRTRVTFGYRNVNAFAAIVSSFCILLMLSERNKWFRYMFSLVMTYVFFQLTDSRTMLLSVIFFIVVSEVGNALIKFNRKGILFFICCCFAILPVFVSLATGLITSMFPLLDLILSGRLAFLNEFYESLSFIQLIVGGAEPDKSLTVDNGFGLLLGAVGVPAFFAMMLIFFSRLKQLIRCDQYLMIAFMLSFWISSFSESSIVRPESIIGLIFWSALFTKFRNSKNYLQ